MTKLLERRIPLLAVVITITALVFSVGCGSAQPPASTESNLPPPINVHREGLGYTFNTPQSMCTTVAVAEVTVQARGTAHWNSADEKRPVSLDADTLLREGYDIYTPVLFSQERLLLDQRRFKGNEIVTVGGRVGQDQIQDTSFPQLTIGSHYLVVLMPGTDPVAQGYTQRWLVVYNAFLIDGQGNVILQPRMVEQGTVVQQEGHMALSDVATQLAACPSHP